MQKLYWRVKRNNKWTWLPVEIVDKITHEDTFELLVSKVEVGQ